MMVINPADYLIIFTESDGTENQINAFLTEDQDTFVFVYNDWLYSTPYVMKAGKTIAVRPSRLVPINLLQTNFTASDHKIIKQSETSPKETQNKVDIEALLPNLKKGVEYIKNSDLDLTTKNTLSFINWVTDDYMKYNGDKIDVKRDISKVAGRWFVQFCSETSKQG